METPAAVKLWINTHFRDEVERVCRKPEQLALLKVCRELENPEEALASFVSSVVLEIAGMEPDEQ